MLKPVYLCHRRENKVGDLSKNKTTALDVLANKS
jgi:hypothetical protein